MAVLVAKQFTQTDPMPYGAGSSFESAYVYARSSPLVYVDPSGKRAWCKNERGCSGSDRVIGRGEWGAKNPITEGRSWEPAIPPGLALTLADVYDSIVIHHTGNKDDYVKIGQLQKKEQAADFADIPYHFAVDRYGNVFTGRPINIKGAHVKGANTGKIGVVLMTDLDTKESGWDRTDGKLTAGMRSSAEWLVGDLVDKYGIRMLGGHKEYANQQGDGRTCPGDVGMRFVNDLRQKLRLAAP